MVRLLTGSVTEGASFAGLP